MSSAMKVSPLILHVVGYLWNMGISVTQENSPLHFARASRLVVQALANLNIAQVKPCFQSAPVVESSLHAWSEHVRSCMETRYWPAFNVMIIFHQ